MSRRSNATHVRRLEQLGYTVTLSPVACRRVAAHLAVGVLADYVQNGTSPAADVLLLDPKVISIDNINEASTPH